MTITYIAMSQTYIALGRDGVGRYFFGKGKTRAEALSIAYKQ